MAAGVATCAVARDGRETGGVNEAAAGQGGMETALKGLCDLRYQHPAAVPWQPYPPLLNVQLVSSALGK